MKGSDEVTGVVKFQSEDGGGEFLRCGEAVGFGDIREVERKA